MCVTRELRLKLQGWKRQCAFFLSEFLALTTVNKCKSEFTHLCWLGELTKDIWADRESNTMKVIVHEVSRSLDRTFWRCSRSLRMSSLIQSNLLTNITIPRVRKFMYMYTWAVLSWMWTKVSLKAQYVLKCVCPCGEIALYKQNLTFLYKRLSLMNENNYNRVRVQPKHEMIQRELTPISSQLLPLIASLVKPFAVVIILNIELARHKTESHELTKLHRVWVRVCGIEV